ncbi:hypothetical protein REPUB_Repub07fG0052800 [Reevesia pubescens]
MLDVLEDNHAEMQITRNHIKALILYSLFGSIGAMMSAAMSGRIADYIGRKYTMAFSEIFCIVGWLAILFSKATGWLDLGRLLVGYGIGLLSYVVPVYIAEVTPKNIRGGFTSVHKVHNICGHFLHWNEIWKTNTT